MFSRSKLSALFLIIVFLTVSGLGCKGVPADQQAALKALTLEYWTVYSDVDALQPLIDAYHAQRPYITINLRVLREDEIYNRLVEALAEDHGPDVIALHFETGVMGLLIVESKAYKNDPNGAINDAVKFFLEVDNGLHDTRMRQIVQGIRSHLSDEHKNAISPSFW